MTHMTSYNPAYLPPAPAGYYYVSEIPANDPYEKRFPTFLGMISALYFVSVCALARYSTDVSWVPQVIGGLLGGAWIVVGLFALGQPVRWCKPITLFVLYALWGTTGMMVTINFEYYFIIWKTIIKIMMVTWVVMQCVKTRKDYLTCCFFVGVAAIVILIQGMDNILQAVSFESDKDESFNAARVTGLLIGNANNLGIFGVVSLVCSTACLLGLRSVILRTVCVGSMVSALYIVAASGSRTAMVGVLVAAVSVYFYQFRKSGGGALAMSGGIGKKITIAVITLMLVGGAVYYVRNLPFFFRLADVLSSREKMEEEPRYQYFKAALGAVIQHPVVGLGWGGFALAKFGTNQDRQGQYSHSSVSETLSTAGIPGFLLFYGALFALFRLLLRIRKLSLSRADKTAVNMILVHVTVLTLLSVIAVLDRDRLNWPLIGAACGYLWNLDRTYGRAPAYAPS